LALRGARVSDYNGKSLNSGDEHSQIFIDPDHRRTGELKTWWKKQPADVQFISITGGVTAQVVIGSGVTTSITATAVPGERSDNFKLAAELVEELSNFQMSKPGGYRLEGNSFSDKNSQTRFYKISGYVKMIFNDEKILYLSCPDCRKKVVEELGRWKCEHC
jgi:hypothetical protein